MISGKENYRRAIDFRNPEYLPSYIGVDFGFLRDKDAAKTKRAAELLERMPNDLLGGVDCFHDRERYVRDGVEHTVDEWGTEWVNDGHGGITAFHPMEAGYPEEGAYEFPDPEKPGRFDEAAALLKDCVSRYSCFSVWFTLFERLWMLRGFANALLDLYQDTGNFLRLKGRILEINLEMIRRFLALGVDALFFSDDWGGQRGLLINPDDWRKYFKPDYAAMFRPVRDAGAHVWFHSCGDISAIIPDLIDVGVSVLHPVQPQAMDVARLAREYGGMLCFNGGVDVQGTMIRGTPGDVKDELRRLAGLFGRYGGGYICGTSHSIMPETPLDNVIALLEAYFEISGYPR